jgi:hypothetical protein
LAIASEWAGTGKRYAGSPPTVALYQRGGRGRGSEEAVRGAAKEQAVAVAVLWRADIGPDFWDRGAKDGQSRD